MAERDDDAGGGDEYERDLKRDNQRDRQRHTMSDLADEMAAGPEVGDRTAGQPLPSRPSPETDQGEFPQHARKGQAESPVEDTHYEPPKRKEGHGQPHIDR